MSDEGGNQGEPRHQHCSVPGAQSDEDAQRSEELDAGRQHRDRIGADRDAVAGQIPGEALEPRQLVEAAIQEDRGHQHATEEQYDIAAYHLSLGSCRHVSMSTRFRHSRLSLS